MKKSVLIIDDEMALGEVVKEFLDGLGYQTFFALDAEQGLAIVEEEKPSVILLDVLMPRISGLECLSLIKEKNPESIVIMISGMQDETIAKEAIHKGAYDYVTKPFDLEYLQNNLLGRIFTN